MTSDERRRLYKKLPKEKRLSKIFNFMQTKKAQDMGATKALEELKSRGLGMRRKDFLRKFKLVKEEGYTVKQLKEEVETLTLDKKGKKLKYIRKNKKVSDRLMTKIDDMEVGNYQYVFEAQFTDGRVTHITVASFKNITVGEAEETALELLKSRSTRYLNEIKKITLIEVRKGI